MDTKSTYKNYIKIILACLILFACTPQKRLNRLITRHPQLLQLDTLVIRDTVIVDSYNYDTTTIIRLHDSTIVINNERVILKYYYDTLREIIYHEVECLGDTVYTEKIITVEKAVFKELSWWEKYREFIYIGLVLILTLTVLKKIGKILI
jgi:hypothetical protein